MLRITQRTDESGRDLVELEGRLVGEWVEVLRRTVETLRAGPARAIVLDLREVRFAGHEGVTLLRSFRRQGLQLRGVPPFLRHLCGEAAGVPNPEEEDPR